MVVLKICHRVTKITGNLMELKLVVKVFYFVVNGLSDSLSNKSQNLITQYKIFTILRINEKLCMQYMLVPDNQIPITRQNIN